MVRLGELIDLPRPGNGFAGDHWPGFLADPRVASLGWPTEVVQQFLFDHGKNADFLDQYGHLELETVEWTLDALAGVEFQVASCYEGFQAWFDGAERDPEHHLGMRPADRAHWTEFDTWRVPPVLLDPVLLRASKAGLHIVEGHTRIGILRGRIRLGQTPAQATHTAFVGREVATVTT